jgi:lipopolysaccharide export system permease protein
MLKKLDKYIIRKFLSTFFFTALIFTLIAGVIDFSEKVEKIIEEPITAREVALGYYANFILYIDGLLWPLFTLIAVIFFTSRMAYNSEIISIFNAGVSFQRLLRPYLISAAFVASLLLLGNHYVIPNGNKSMLNIVYTYFDKNKDKGKTRDVHLFVDPDTKVYVRNFRKRDSTATDFRVEHFRGDELAYLIKANRAEWQGPPNQWRLHDYEKRTFDGINETFLHQRGQYIDTTLNFSPDDFVDFAEQQAMMTTPELKRFIHKQERRGAGNVQKYKIELYRRSAEPFTIFILTIIGVAIAARKVRGGVGLHLAIGVGIGALFIFLSRFAIVFATGKAIPALLGIWSPNLVFSFVALLLIRRAQK